MTALDVIRCRSARVLHELRCVRCGAPFAWRNPRRRQCLDCEHARAVELAREFQRRRVALRKLERAS